MFETKGTSDFQQDLVTPVTISSWTKPSHQMDMLVSLFFVSLHFSKNLPGSSFIHSPPVSTGPPSCLKQTFVPMFV